MPNQFNNPWTDEMVQHGLELKQVHKLEKVTEILNETYGTEISYNGVRDKLRREGKKVEPNKPTKEIPNFKETTEIKEDGSRQVESIIELSNKEKKDPAYILRASGYDPNEWHIRNVKFSRWHHLNKTMDEPKTLYAVKLDIEPKVNGFDFNELVEALERRPIKKPIPFKGIPQQETAYLEIPLYDLHFGIADIDYYQETLQKTLNLLQKSYKEVLIPIGQDLFHNNDFKGQTANGTKIDQVDMVKATDDAELFYISIIDEALKHSDKVTIVYSKGNHDEVPSYYFVRGLRHLYKQDKRVVFDIELKERKAHMLGRVFLGLTHGDKNRANLAANFSVEFPEMWAKATTRECHIGHLHRKKTTKKNIEIINDSDGLIVRELGTGNMTDNYHDENGYNLAHKEFEIFEYNETKKERIHYV